MAQIKLTVQGLNKLIANYEKRANALNARQMVILATAAVHAQADKLVPVSTPITNPGGAHGNLRRSLTPSVDGNKNVAEGAVSTNVEYAPYVEFGTRKMRAQPYLRPAVRIVKPKIDNLVINEIRKAMKV